MKLCRNVVLGKTAHLHKSSLDIKHNKCGNRVGWRGRENKMNLKGYYPELMPSHSILKVEPLTQSFLGISQGHKMMLGCFLRLLKPYLLYWRAWRILLPHHLKCLYHHKLKAQSCHLETIQPNAILYNLYSTRPWIKLRLYTFHVV